MTPPDPAAPLGGAFTDAVSRAIAEFLGQQATVLEPLGPELGPMQQIAAELASGGKRLRPAFCYWAYVAAAGDPAADRQPLIRAAASLDLLHISALVHDDVMDGSDLRRGRPSAHRRFERLHADLGWVGDPAAFGRAGAILLGDLLLIWSMEMLQRSGLDLPTIDRGLPIMERMRTEVTAGQFLDVVSQARDRREYLPVSEPEATDRLGQALREAERVVEYKSARYTVRRPLQFGAALGGADRLLQDRLGDFGSPLGRAFQYRDDLLGVFGDSDVTGKPSGDDLREGKRTVLVAQALARTDAVGRKLLEDRLGDPELDAAGVARLQELITASGARQAVEEMIEHDHQRALEALQAADITDDGHTALTALASAAVRRTF